jgi:Protein of unknown function (DUF2442)
MNAFVISSAEDAILDAVLRPANKPAAVCFRENQIVVTLIDGREIAMPMDWFPFLKSMTAQQRMNYEIMGWSVNWEDEAAGINEGFSMELALLGWPDHHKKR